MRAYLERSPHATNTQPASAVGGKGDPSCNWHCAPTPEANNARVMVVPRASRGYQREEGQNALPHEGHAHAHFRRQLDLGRRTGAWLCLHTFNGVRGPPWHKVLRKCSHQFVR